MGGDDTEVRILRYWWRPQRVRGVLIAPPLALAASPVRRCGGAPMGRPVETVVPILAKCRGPVA